MGLNNMSGWDTILNKAKEIASGVSKESAQKWWNDYMVQSSDELSSAGRDLLQATNTLKRRVDMKGLDDHFSRLNNKDADAISNYSRLKQEIKAGNIDEAKKIADRFEDKKFMEFLTDAERRVNHNASMYDSLDSDEVKMQFKSEFEIPNFAKKIVGDKEEKIANLAYKTQAKRRYFSTDDPKINRTRIGVVGGAYAGGAMVVRGIQGGNPITNEYGERDIAGIPLI